MPTYGSGQTSDEVTVRVMRDDIPIFGLPLGWDGKQAVLLKTDGAIRLVPADSEDDATVVAKSFTAATREQLKRNLKKEFGGRYDVSLTEHYVVVHPWGKPDFWAKPFEDFYDRFEFFMEEQGVELVDPRFPQIVVVMRSRGDFDRYMHNEANYYARNVVGFYSRMSNRMVTYDPAQMLRLEEDSWLYNSPTVIHEAVHQLAFNRGVHNRVAPPPLWLSEGLAMLFEAPGVNHAEKYGEFKTRINSERFSTLKKLYKRDKIKGRLGELISTDRIFGTESELAYSLSWAVNFYLMEKEPEKYFEFLRQDSERDDFSVESPPERLKRFANHFGNDLEALEDAMRVYFVGTDAKKK